VFTLTLRDAADGGAQLSLFIASDAPQTAVGASGLVRIRSAQVSNVFGNPLETQSLKEGSVKVAIAACLTAALHMK